MDNLVFDLAIILHVARIAAPHSGSVEDEDKWQELRRYLR